MEHPIQKQVIFDGQCNLCNGTVRWLQKHLPANQYQFVPFKSPAGQQLLLTHGFKTERLDTVILIDQEGVHTLSDGFLRLLSTAPNWKPIAMLLKRVPRIFRDTIYKTAARHRVLLFGHSNTCVVNY